MAFKSKILKKVVEEMEETKKLPEPKKESQATAANTSFALHNKLR